MKRAIVCMLLAIFVSAPASADGANSYALENFRWTGSIDGELRNAGLYQIHLDASVLERCSMACRDLRIIDAGSREIPFVIIENRDSGIRPEIYRLEVIGFDERPSEIYITVRMPDKYRPITQMELDIPEQDFRRDIVLEGSADAESWSLIARDQIFDFTSQVDLRKKHISFGASDFRYYRITLRDNIKKAPSGGNIKLSYRGLDFSATDMQTKKLHIGAVTGKTFSEKAATAVYDEQVLTLFKSEPDKKGNTVISFETGLPFTRISLDLSNPYFYRKTLLYSSDTGSEDSFRLLYQGALYRFLLSDILETRNVVENGISGWKFYRLVIENGSNPPLDIRSIKLGWVQKLLYFVALDEAISYTAVFGSSDAVPPAYDLANSVNQSNWQQFRSEKMEIKDIRQNPGFKQGINKDRGAKQEKIILTAIICLLVAGISVWLYTLLKKAGNKTDA